MIRMSANSTDANKVTPVSRFRPVPVHRAQSRAASQASGDLARLISVCLLVSFACLLLAPKATAIEPVAAQPILVDVQLGGAADFSALDAEARADLSLHIVQQVETAILAAPSEGVIALRFTDTPLLFAQIDSLNQQMLLDASTDADVAMA